MRYPFLKTKKGVAVMVCVPLLLACGLSGLAALPGKSSDIGEVSDVAAADRIGGDEHFYGDSPPVYPSREYWMPSCLPMTPANPLSKRR